VRVGNGAVGCDCGDRGAVVHLGVEEDRVVTGMEENPYEAPQVGTELERPREAERIWRIWLAGLYAFIGFIWTLLLVAILLPTTYVVVENTRVTVPSPASRVFWLAIGGIPAVGFFWLAIRSVRR
jgi:hypothetical protein